MRKLGGTNTSKMKYIYKLNIHLAMPGMDLNPVVTMHALDSILLLLYYVISYYNSYLTKRLKYNKKGPLVITFLLPQIHWTYSCSTVLKTYKAINYFPVILSISIPFHKINIHFQHKITLIFTKAFTASAF